MKAVIMFLVGFSVVTSAAVAAIPKMTDVKNSELILALRLPLETRIKAVQALGEGGFESLQKMSMDESQPLQIRWRAVTAMGRVSAKKSIPFLEKALKSSDWLMRNAALLALSHADRARGLAAATAMLEDPALVVRTSAVQVIDELNGTEKLDLLWQKLFAKENFHNGHSLWIRRHITDLLAKYAKPGWEAKFQRVLEDEDEALHPMAIQALEKTTGERLSAETQEPRALRALWLQRLSELKKDKVSTEI